MRELIQTRLGVLKQEFGTGQAELQRLEQQQIALRETMLRISGAIQILEELLAEAEPIGQSVTAPDEIQFTTVQANGASV